MENKNSGKNKSNVNGGLYIALAICILSVICVGVYSAIISVFTPDDPVPTDSGIPEITTKETTVKPHENVKKDEKPVIENKTEEKEADAEPIIRSFSKPVPGAVSKGFSPDELVFSETMNDYRTHRGVDLEANVGDPVKCFSKGVVSEIYEDALMGETVVISHGDGLFSLYGNLSTELPSEMAVGKEVDEGEVIGGVGESCLIECAELPHLHFEVISNGENVDPMSFFG